MPCHAILLPCMCAVVLLGCSGSSGLERLAIRGDVRMDGVGVEQGTITLIPVDQTKGPSVGAAISAAKYSIDAPLGPTVGTYRVEIRSPKPTGKKISAPPPQPPGTLIDETAEGIPTKYNSETTLRIQVVRDRAVYDFDLKSP